MLVIISDLHLGDGTTAASIPVSAFYLFAKRLRQDAHFASMRRGKYRPIEELDVILMGDIIDPLHSTKWLFPPKGQEQYVEVDGKKHIRITEEGDADYVRPWSDPSHPLFAPKLLEVTQAIIEHNREALDVLRRLANGETIVFDPSSEDGNRDTTSQSKIPLRVRFHYMTGNHDWYYHLPGEAFDRIRRELIEAMGLSNPPTPFPAWHHHRLGRGSAAVTPASGFIKPTGAIWIGIGAAALCYYTAVVLKSKLGYDDTLDAFGVHGVGGIWGVLATGLFATKAVNPAGADGLFYGGSALLGAQLKGTLVTAVWSLVGTYAILKALDVLMGLRVSEHEERIGLDLTGHRESAYTLLD